MIGDITTMMTKEWREFFTSSGSRRSGFIGILIILVVFGLYLPYRIGQVWVETPLSVFFYSVYLPLTLVISVIADSIAGERERHTLETLLASRLSDRAIILGKLGAAAGYSLVISILAALVGMVAANLQGGKSFQLYPIGILISIIAFSLLVAILFAGIGVLVSLRASTVRQAQQVMSVAMIVVFLLPALIFAALSNTARQQFLGWLSSANWTTISLIVAVVLVVFDLLTIAVVMARFQRSRLILS